MMPESFPAAADVERFGNLLLQAWAPPAHESLADDWIESAVRALLAGANDVYPLGHRPGVLSNVPHDAVSQEIVRLSSTLTRDLRLGPLHRIPHEAAIGAAALLRPGDLHVRHRRLDETTGMARVSSTHLGRALVLVSVPALVQVVQSVELRGPLRLLVSVLTNAYVGLRQTDAKWLRSIRNWTGRDVVVTWRGDSLCLLGGRDALLGLRTRLLEWLREPAGGA